MLSSWVVVLLTAAPVADVWPYAARRLSDGSVEYSFDLTAVKRSNATVDAHEAHGDLAVANFLKGLPRDVKVRVAAEAPLDLSAGKGPENRPLATSFALVSDDAFEAENPLGKHTSARLRPALHPDEPKLLLTAEMLALATRALENATLAAEEIDTESMRREVWSKVAERALARFKTAQGDEREGALALAARALVANACLDAARLAPTLKNDAEVSMAVSAELQRVNAAFDLTAPPVPFGWSPELTCIWVRHRVLGQPLENSRAGTAAVLLFFDVLKKEPKLKALDARIRARRDRFLGVPLHDSLRVWEQQLAGDSSKALESLSDFIEALPLAERTPPALVALGSTPFEHFMSELTGAERAAAWEELASAVQDGRVTPSSATWPQAREAALVPFVVVDEARLQVDSHWREQLRASFAAVQGGAIDLQATDSPPKVDSADRSELKVRLLVPPFIELEPLPHAFAAQARALEALVEALNGENLQSLRVLGFDGRRGEVALTEARRWSTRLKALATLAGTARGADARELAEARRFVETWRGEVSLGRDVREVIPAAFAGAGERMHAAVLGVARRELVVGFSSEVKGEFVGSAPAGVELDTSAQQRYLVPVLHTVGVRAPASARPLDRATFKALVDGAGRDATRAESAILETLH